VLAGGAVTHDHFAATGPNLAALRAGGAGRVVVLVRDPRAVFWSLEGMQTEYDGVPPADRMTGEHVGRVVKLLADWVDTWVTAAAAGFPLEFVRFRELTADPAGVMCRVLERAGAGHFLPAVHDALRQRAERNHVSNNFRRGDDDAWRAHVPADLHPAAWAAIPAGVRALLDLRP
jgi:hypothetical protein